ncbi:hypothetical protein KVP09_07165 [Alcaligenaceae bacterium CGII-47]|nr:hypothetical protein [Alcaligenaceae bacterium CGII-47]
MSWRLIFAILLITAGAAAWGGLQLGDWLIAHGPEASIAPVVNQTTPLVPVLDADGKPHAAVAPQPLPDGRLGVPAPQPPVDWAVTTSPLMDSAPPIALATTMISMDEAIQLASMQRQDGLQGIADASALDPSRQPIQPIDITQAPPPAAASVGTGATRGDWQAAFRRELSACEGVGFFSRPTCAWAARNKYCEPNGAWGLVDGCPARRQGN